MKNNTTTSGAATTGNFSFHKVFILFIILMFIPGCMNNTAKSEIRVPSSTVENKVTTSFISIISSIDKGAYTPVNNSQPPLNQTSHIMQPEADHQFDPHENGEEENVIAVDLPLLLRIAIILSLFVFIL